ncbi:cytochrome P450 [Mollisia scopiformis]|uniref:Cytochrome P450 n=1 Tax=Mollisia scopiformis TaxID=149040 RepID=A0A194XBW5_MOLSC|nr:cytochrome P450 [Mollisia scopiformis]KUJ17651.1 cytochrome P450 [Mollisia scopiformis]
MQQWAYWPHLLALSVFVLLVYTFVSRRYLHPLAKIPGPFLWSISTLPMLYHQGVREGKLLHELIKLHEKYGPIIRISPTQVHLNDLDSYEKIYSIGTKFSKDPLLYGTVEKTIKTPIITSMLSNEEHKVRRTAINPFFSRRSVLDLEGVVASKASKLCDMLEACGTDGKPFDAHNAVRAFSADVITEYSYGHCWNMLDRKDFGVWYEEAIRATQFLFIWFQTFPFLIAIFDLIPEWVNVALNPGFKHWYASIETIRHAVEETRSDITQGIKPERRTIFHELISPRNPEPGMKQHAPLSNHAIFADAVNITGGGGETTGAIIIRAMFEVVNNQVIYKNLTTELREAFPDPESMCLKSLEALPYLNAVIKEALRLNPGAPGRLPRVVPPGGTDLAGVNLPGGTTVSMSIWVMHQRTDYFPDPRKFIPDRWLGSIEEVRARERCLMPFSKGSRNCVGQNLAMCEVYCSLGAIFRRFDDMQVYGGFTHSDMEMVDLFIGYHPRKAKKLKIYRTGVAA